MSIYDVGIENGKYGKYYIDKKGNTKFRPLGNAIFINSINENIETHSVNLVLEYSYLGESKLATVSREIFVDPKLLAAQAGIGVDASRNNLDIIVDTLRLQEQSFGPSLKIYENLGWFKLNTRQGIIPCFRANTLIGSGGTYVGEYKISSMGDFDKWRDMVIKDILGDPIAEITLLASLSAVIVPIVSPIHDCGNPILHLYGISGSGKSTHAQCGASVGGEPFDGDKSTLNPIGETKSIHSIYRSWGATPNALINSCAGNQGYPIIFNELGKCLASDLSQTIYNLSEGTDKLRMNQYLKSTQSQGYSTSFISTGEYPLLERCKDKADGLRIRVLELETEKTPNGAERADRIKSVCKRNNGHAIPMLAEHILNIGFETVQETYRKIYKESVKLWTPSENHERFISKFVAVYLTTAEIASTALKIPFNINDIQKFLLNHYIKNSESRNSSLASYDVLLEDFNVHRKNFVSENDEVPKGDCWGRITKENKKIDEKTYIVERFLVFRDIMGERLRAKGYNNISSCVKEWKKKGLIDFEKGHNTRSRKIYPTSSKKYEVFVFNVFEDRTVPDPIIIYNKNANLLKED